MRILRGLGWTYSAYAFEAVAGLLTVAIVVRTIGVAEYGVLMLALSIASLLMLLDLGLLGLLVQAYAGEREKSGPSGVTGLLGAATGRLVSAGMIGFGVCSIIALTIPGPFRIEQSLADKAARVFLIIGASLSIALPSLAVELAYVASRSFGALSRIQILIAAIRATITILLVRNGFGIVALAGVHLGIALLRYALLSIGLPKATGGARLSIKSGNPERLAALRANRPWATGDNLARQLATAADSLLLGAMASTSAVAIYGIAKRIPGQLQAITGRGVDVTLPALAEHHHQDDQPALRRLFTSTLLATSALLFPVCLLGIVFAPEIIHIIAGDQYASAATMMRWLLAATLMQSFSVPSYAVLYARAEVATAARIGMAEAVANIILTIALIPRFGGAGAAAATAVTHTVGTLGFFLPAAMRAAGMGPRDLVTSIGETVRTTLRPARAA